MSIEANQAVVRRYWEAFNRKVLSILDEVLSPNMVLWFPASPEPVRGIEANKQLAGAYFAAFPDMENTIEDVIAVGDRVAVRYTLRATHTGPLPTPGGSIPPTGRQVTVTGINFLRLEDGRIVEDRAQPNMLDLLQQLGVMPAPKQQAAAAG